MKCKYCGNDITELHPAWDIPNSEGIEVFHHFLFCDRCWSGYEYFAPSDGTIIEDVWYEPGSQNYLEDWFASIAGQVGQGKD